MYGETGGALRTALAALLREHRVQPRLGTSTDERGHNGALIQRYRHTVLTWCSQTLESVRPVAFSNQPPRQPNPFRARDIAYDEAALIELAAALGQAVAASSVRPATLEQLNAPSNKPTVELWRAVARAAALAEHDTAPNIARSMTVPQAQAVVGDVAAVTQALIVLDRRYTNTPGWRHLSQPARLGWATLAAALDVNLGQPDYTVDRLGWRPRAKPISGPTKPGILGVLQAEHNAVARASALPSMASLRYLVDSQRLLSHHLVPIAARVDPRLADRWQARATTYRNIQRELRSLGGILGTGTSAATEGANAVARIRALPSDLLVEPRILGGFQLLFGRLDTRVADIFERSIERGVLFERIQLPRLDEDTGSLVTPVCERFVPTDANSHRELLAMVNRDLRPKPPTQTRPGPSRVALHTALVRRPPSQGAPSNVPTL